jgi:hypothetical protein
MNPRNLYVIDSGVNDFQALIDKLPDGSEWILLDPARDGVLQLQEILLNYQGLDSLHILSHGASGALYLGTTALTHENLSDYADALHSIGAALSPGGDLLLYGCAVAEGVSGTIFVERLAQATGADCWRPTRHPRSAFPRRLQPPMKLNTTTKRRLPPPSRWPRLAVFRGSPTWTGLRCGWRHPARKPSASTRLH